jgi:hypothetical protein
MKDFVDFFKDPNRREVLEGIGIVVSAASALEWEATQLVCDLLSNPLAEMVVTGQHFDQTSQAAIAIAEQRVPGDLAGRIKDAFRRGKSLYEQRSQVAHGSWFFAEGNEHGLSIRMRRWGASSIRKWSKAELWQLAAELAALAQEFEGLAAEVRASP